MRLVGVCNMNRAADSAFDGPPGKPYVIESDVVALVAELAKPEPFESFSDALRRVLEGVRDGSGSGQSGVVGRSVDELLADIEALPEADGDRLVERVQQRRRERAPSPDPQLWVGSVSELRNMTGLNSWKAICDHFRINVGGDSARRKLQDWVRKNKPHWPSVPDA